MCNRENLDNLSISAESLWKRCVKSQHYDFILHQAVWHQEGFSQYAENLDLEGEKICDMAWNLSLALMRVDPLHLTSSTSRLFMSHLLLVLYFENISIIFYNGLYDIGINLNAYMILLGLYIYIYLIFNICYFSHVPVFQPPFLNKTTGFFITLPRTAGVMPPALWSACWSWSGCPTAGAGRPGAMAKILLLKLNPPKKGKDTQHVTYCREINRNFPGISGNWPKTH